MKYVRNNVPDPVSFIYFTVSWGKNQSLARYEADINITTSHIGAHFHVNNCLINILLSKDLNFRSVFSCEHWVKIMV